MPRLHKIDYHHPESLKPVRLLAECYLSLGKGEQAARHYERIMTEHADELTSTDLRKAACCYWLQDERERCFKCLQRAEELFNEEEEGIPFAQVLTADLQLLKRLSTHEEELTYFNDAYHRSKRK